MNLTGLLFYVFVVIVILAAAEALNDYRGGPDDE